MIAPAAFDSDIQRAYENITWHINDHIFYVVSAEIDGETRYLCTQPGKSRWCNRLGYALAGRGYWLNKDSAQHDAIEFCKIYGDVRLEDIKVLELPKNALDELKNELDLYKSQLQEAIERSRSQKHSYQMEYV